jgi:hypothetical protein
MSASESFCEEYEPEAFTYAKGPKNDVRRHDRLGGRS